jgi:hypothetical protein
VLTGRKPVAGYVEVAEQIFDIPVRRGAARSRHLHGGRGLAGGDGDRVVAHGARNRAVRRPRRSLRTRGSSCASEGRVRHWFSEMFSF